MIFRIWQFRIPPGCLLHGHCKGRSWTSINADMKLLFLNAKDIYRSFLNENLDVMFRMKIGCFDVMSALDLTPAPGCFSCCCGFDGAVDDDVGCWVCVLLCRLGTTKTFFSTTTPFSLSTLLSTVVEAVNGFLFTPESSRPSSFSNFRVSTLRSSISSLLQSQHPQAQPLLKKLKWLYQQWN